MLTFEEFHIALVTNPPLLVVEVFKRSLVPGAHATNDFSTASAMVASPSDPKNHVANLGLRNGSPTFGWMRRITWQAETL